MARRTQFDPLACIPSSEAIREPLDETERLARRLRILLRTAEAIERGGDGEEQPSSELEVAHAE